MGLLEDDDPAVALFELQGLPGNKVPGGLDDNLARSFFDEESLKRYGKAVLGNTPGLVFPVKTHLPVDAEPHLNGQPRPFADEVSAHMALGLGQFFRRDLPAGVDELALVFQRQYELRRLNRGRVVGMRAADGDENAEKGGDDGGAEASVSL